MQVTCEQYCVTHGLNNDLISKIYVFYFIYIEFDVYEAT